MNEHQLPEDQGHIVSFYEYGNPDGVPVLNFHGGPGSKSKPKHAEQFDLSKYRVIQFDQRGCGKSTPLGKLEGNTTADLLSDAERIREAFGIDRWFVSGGSWGSTLALLYAIEHPERVQGLLLSSVFLADKDSISWAMSDPTGAARLMPDVLARRTAFFERFSIRPESQNEDIFTAFNSLDLEEQKEVAAGVQNWEWNLMSPYIAPSYTNPEDISEADIAAARIFIHYEQNHAFIPEGHILANTSAIQSIPTVIVHGRYDILCPIEKAYALTQQMKECELVIATSSGHRLTAEGDTIRQMAFDRFLERHA